MHFPKKQYAMIAKDMYSEIVGTLLASLGGATVLVGVFTHFLGKVWADRIATTTAAKFHADLERLKATNAASLEQFKARSTLLLREQEHFAGISLDFYQRFFSERVDTYLKLLEIKNQYITEMEEELATEIHQVWGEIYHGTYTSLRKLIVERQIYISNELDGLFREFREKASEYVKEADMAEAFAHAHRAEPPWEDRRRHAVYDKFARETGDHMRGVMDQIGFDVAKLRSRIELR